MAGAGEGPGMHPDDRLSAVEAAELEARARYFARMPRRDRPYDTMSLPQNLLVPSVHDPDMWAIRVKVDLYSLHFSTANVF